MSEKLGAIKKFRAFADIGRAQGITVTGSVAICGALTSTADVYWYHIVYFTLIAIFYHTVLNTYIAKEHNVVFHSDTVQSAGKILVDVKKTRIDLLSISSHKIYGPKGVGALYIRKGVKLQPIVHGGGHEKNLRSGTENISGIAGFGKACELAKTRLNKDAEHLTNLRDKLIKSVLNIEESYLNGHLLQRLPNNAHFRFTGIEGEALILSLDEKGIAASTGSACSSKKLLPSHVLMAIGLNEVEAHGSLRLTLGRENTDEDVRYVIDVLPGIVENLRRMSPLWGKKLEIEKWKKEMK